MHTVNILNQLVENHHVWAYLVIFLGLILEGEVVVIFAGVLANLGALQFWLALIFILAGFLAKIFLLYWFGGFLQKKYNHTKVFQYLEKKVTSVMPRFADKPFWSVFISTFIMGVGYMVMIFSGYKRVDFKTYLKAGVSSILIWAPAMLSLGYFFSYTAFSISKEFWKFSLVILLLVIGFIMFDKLIAWVYQIFQEFSNSAKK